MDETLDRRVRYAKDVKNMTDRAIREFTFVELRDLSYHVRVNVNGKLRILWACWQWGKMTGKILGVVAVLSGVLIALKEIWG